MLILRAWRAVRANLPPSKHRKKLLRQLVWGMAANDPSGFPWLPVLAMFLVPFGVVVWMNLKVSAT